MKHVSDYKGAPCYLCEVMTARRAAHFEHYVNLFFVIFFTYERKRKPAIGLPDNLLENVNLMTLIGIAMSLS